MEGVQREKPAGSLEGPSENRARPARRCARVLGQSLPGLPHLATVTASSVSQHRTDTRSKARRLGESPLPHRQQGKP